MAEVRFTAEAIRDIDEIHAFIAQDSVRYADRQVQLFYDEASRLSQHPLFGKRVAEAQPLLVREILVGNYRIMYRLLDDVVEIMIIHHSKRRFPQSRIAQISTQRRKT